MISSFLATAVLIINEIMASNTGTVMSPATNFDSWIELYNPSDEYIQLSGMFLSDDANNPTRWCMPTNIGVVPARGYKVIWLGSNNIKNNQAPFKLNCDGGTIYLSDKDGQLITSENYPEALSRTSYARKTDGGEEWGITADPTPGQSNLTSIFASQRLEPPVVNQDSKIFNGSITVNVSIPQGCTLLYTTDGSIPMLSKGKAVGKVSTDGIFTIANTMNLCFRLFKEGWLPSVPVTRSYIKTANKYTIPVVSIVGDKKYFTDNQWGIDTKGTNGKTGNGQSTKCNWNMDWERPINFSFITPDGEMVYNQDVEISVSGGWTRSATPRSFKLKAGKEFDGRNTLDYTFFPQKPYLRNKVLLLRNGGNDIWENNGSRFLDPALQTIIQRSGIDLDLQSYVPIIEYVNGEFRGVLNMREPNNKKYVESNFGYDDEKIDMFEMSADSNVVFMVGTKDVLERIYELGTHAAEPNVYEELKQLLDIDEFTNYMATELYLGSTDWPHNNIKGYRSQEDGRYRFVTFDLDFAFKNTNPFTAFENDQWHKFNLIYDTNEERYEEIKLVTLFLNMLDNDEFRKKFIDTFCLIGGSVFEKGRATKIVNELADNVRPMMQLDGWRSPDTSANLIISKLNDLTDKMTSCMQQFKYMKLAETKRQSVQISSDIEDANIFLNDIEIPYANFKGYLFAPVSLEAKAPAGYTFTGWKKSSAATNTLIDWNSDWKYYDKGAQNSIIWRSINFNDTSWSTGESPLGYKTPGIKTTVGYGTNANQKNPTTYFRKTVSLNKTPSADDLFILDYQVDDGFVIYVNGKEAGRVNMPTGSISYNTYSSSYAATDPIEGTLELQASLFHSGSNVIAVEVHNNSATSTDLYWAAQLNTTLGELYHEYISTEAIIDLPSDNHVTLTACFSPLSEEQRLSQGMTPVRINEVSAANAIYVNEYWKRNDWVELYNTTDHPIDIEGMYLTDNIENPHQYRISKNETLTNTMIQPHDYLVIWCDKLETLSQLHASFKLDKDGGDIMLSSADDSWRDCFSYSAHKEDQTVGRYPDGYNDVFVMNVPSISKANLKSSYMVNVKQPSVSGIQLATTESVSSLSVRYVLEHLIVRGNAEEDIHVNIYHLTGQLAKEKDYSLHEGYAEIPVGELPTGYYIARITDKRGETATCKFVKK